MFSLSDDKQTLLERKEAAVLRAQQTAEEREKQRKEELRERGRYAVNAAIEVRTQYRLSPLDLILADLYNFCIGV